MKRMLVWLLSLTMAISVLPVNVMADEEAGADLTVQEEILAEEISEEEIVDEDIANEDITHDEVNEIPEDITVDENDDVIEVTEESKEEVEVVDAEEEATEVEEETAETEEETAEEIATEETAEEIETTEEADTPDEVETTEETETAEETAEEIEDEELDAMASSGTLSNGIKWEFVVNEWDTEGSGILSFTGSGSIPNYSLSNSKTTAPWGSYAGKVTMLQFSENITGIGNYAFYGFSELRMVRVTSNITRIGDYAFANTTGLASFGVFDTSGLVIGKYAFRNSGVYSVDIEGTSVKSVGEGAFKDCKNLTQAVSGMMVAAPYMYENCTSMTKAVLTEIKTVPEGMFRGCTRLLEVLVPYTVSTIEDRAFENCSSLIKMYLSLGVTTMNGSPFNGVATDAIVYYPGKTVPSGWNLQAASGKNLKVVCNMSIDGYNNILKGKTSDTAFWEMKKNGGVDENGLELYTLTISGSGNAGEFMEAMGYGSNNAPWLYLYLGDTESSYGMRPIYGHVQINKVIIKEGITEIGDGFFSDLFNVTEITFPSTLKKISTNGSLMNYSSNIKVYGFSTTCVPDYVKQMNKQQSDYGTTKLVFVNLSKATAIVTAPAQTYTQPHYTSAKGSVVEEGTVVSLLDEELYGWSLLANGTWIEDKYLYIQGTPDPTNADRLGQGKTTKKVTIYAEPSTNAATVGTIAAGSMKNLYRQCGNWYQIYSNSKYVWVRADGFDFTAASTNTKITQGIITATAFIHVGPGLEFSTCGTANEGKTVNVYEIREGWYKIYSGGKYVWIDGNYIYDVATPDPNVSAKIGVGTTTKKITIYEAPNSGSKSLGTIAAAKERNLYAQSGNWYQIYVGGIGFCWVRCDGFSYTKANTNASYATATLLAGSTTYYGPGYQYEPSVELTRGTKVNVYQQIDDWYLVYKTGKYLWINGDVLEVTNK